MTEQTPHDRAGNERRQDRGATAKAGKVTSPRPGGPPGPPRQGRPVVRTRPDRYLVAAVPPADIRAITSQLEQDQSFRITRVLGGHGTSGGFPGVAVVETTAENATLLSAHPGIHVEPDCTVSNAHAGHPPPVVTQRVALEVLDDGMRPIEGAEVTMTGPGFPVTAFTGADGHAEVTATPEMLAAPATLQVRPPRGCWPARVRRPLLGKNGSARVICTRITTTYPEFPERALESWGARVMGFGRLPPTYRGNGVRIALIDSGAAIGHPDLSGRIEHGHDVIGRDEEKGWQEDLLGTGTHHATLIAGRDDGTGIVGLAPEAEIHVCRVAPGGSAAGLIEALDYCIEHQVDVAMFGACVAEPTMLLTAKVEEAWRSGVACIAAAPTAGSSCWPTASPYMLTVGAIGQLGTFPPEDPDTAALTPRLTPEGFFVPEDAARRDNPSEPGPPAVDCCAPGVAVISGLPPSSYGPLSGSGSAAAHVTALAALILAHHPLFRREPGRPSTPRDPSRPARLLGIIRGSCRPLPQLDPARTGVGMPDAAVALSVAPWGVYPPLPMPYPATPYPATAPGPDGRTPLEPLNAAMVAAGLITREPAPGS